MVFMWIRLSMPSADSMASRIRDWASGAAASPSSRLLVSIARITATATRSTPIRAVPTTSQ